jgi:hypothetical protein
MIERPMNQIVFLVVVFLAMGFQSCVPSTVQIPSSPESTSTTTAIPKEVSPTSTPTFIPFNTNWACWPIRMLEKGNDIKGSILFLSRNSKNKTSFIWDVNSFHARNVDFSIDSLTVSSDGSLLATMPLGGNKIVLISSNETKTYPLNQPLPDGKVYGGVRFLPDGKIAVGIHSEDESSINYEPSKSGYIAESYLLDPVTGNLTHNSVLLPDFTLGPRLTRFLIEFSPDMQYVVYKTTSYKDGNYKFALMNVKTGEIIWTGPSLPHWKPDGSSLTYFLGQGEKDAQGYFIYNNLFSLSKDGKSSQMTWFNRTTLYEIGKGYTEIPWSPNGRYAVFIGTNKLSSVFLLYVWDDQEKVALRPCLPEEIRAYTDYSVHWSFDSKYLLIRLVYPDAQLAGELPPPSHSLDLILDMANQIIYTLPVESNRDEYKLQAPDGANIVDWVNWEIP